MREAMLALADGLALRSAFRRASSERTNGPVGIHHSDADGDVASEETSQRAQDGVTETSGESVGTLGALTLERLALLLSGGDGLTSFAFLRVRQGADRLAVELVGAVEGRHRAIFDTTPDLSSGEQLLDERPDGLLTPTAAAVRPVRR